MIGSDFLRKSGHSLGRRKPKNYRKKMRIRHKMETRSRRRNYAVKKGRG